MPSSQAVFTLSDVSRSFRVGLGFRKHKALRNLDLELAPGSSLALVGPNGSGKSTLLRMLAGVDRPSQGSVQVFGGKATDQSVRQRVGWCPENAPFPAEISGLRALRLLAALSGLDRQTVKNGAPAMLAKVGLESAKNRRLHSYSRGMLRRFALAQAFLGSLDLVLLDEPTAGLDGTGFSVLRDLLSEHRQRGGSLVLTSHLVADIHEHCDQIAVLVSGQLVGHGPTAELLSGEGQDLELTGLSPDGLEDLKAWVATKGGQVLSVQPRGRALADLYEAKPQ